MFFTLKRIGLGLVFLGVLLLVALYFLRFTFVNMLLVTPLFLIIGGMIAYVWGQKRTSRY